MRKLCCVFALVMSAAVSASAQLVSIGAIGGVRLTDGFSDADESRWYAVGGSVEIHLPARFAIEGDALYQRIGQTTTFYGIFGAYSSFLITRQRGNSWQFPLYVKYYFRPNAALWQPFVGTGYAFRTVSFHNQSSQFDAPSEVNLNPHYDFRSDLAVGASVAAGIRFHYGRMGILPQVRYTRWGAASGINKNEVTLLLGVTF